MIKDDVGGGILVWRWVWVTRGVVDMLGVMIRLCYVHPRMRPAAPLA